jgi:hypothetical protein
VGKQKKKKKKIRAGEKKIKEEKGRKHALLVTKFNRHLTTSIKFVHDCPMVIRFYACPSNDN